MLEQTAEEERLTALALLKDCRTGKDAVVCAGMGLSAAGGIFFHFCEFRCFSTIELSAKRNWSHRLSNT